MSTEGDEHENTEPWDSFSQDAHKWLSQIADSCGDEIEAVNLYIGSCYPEKHLTNFISKAPDYDMEVNGQFARKISINEALVRQA